MHLLLRLCDHPGQRTADHQRQSYQARRACGRQGGGDDAVDQRTHEIGCAAAVGASHPVDEQGRKLVETHYQYQVVEAQPDVLEAMHSVRYAKVVRRSIHLTPFGEDLCKACLVLDPVEMVDLPRHAQPAADDAVAAPSIADN